MTRGAWVAWVADTEFAATGYKATTGSIAMEVAVTATGFTATGGTATGFTATEFAVTVLVKVLPMGFNVPTGFGFGFVFAHKRFTESA